jgi:hypothetical protein
LRTDLNSLKDTLAKFVATARSREVGAKVTSNVAGQVDSVASDLADKEPK